MFVEVILFLFAHWETEAQVLSELARVIWPVVSS